MQSDFTARYPRVLVITPVGLQVEKILYRGAVITGGYRAGTSSTGARAPDG